MEFCSFSNFYPQFSVTEATSQANNGITASNKSDWPDAPTVMQTFNHNPASAGPINDINIKLDQLMEIIQTQNCQLSELRNEVIELKKSHSNVAATTSKGTPNSEVNTQKLENRLSRIIEEYLVRYEREHSKRLETFLIARFVYTLNIYSMIPFNWKMNYLIKISLFFLQRHSNS